jgi:hypothetical protein
MRVLLTVSVAIVLLLGAGPLSAQLADEAPVGLLVAGEDSEISSLDIGELLVAANTAYETGEYEVAIRDYREILERVGSHGRLHFNLGNAYLRNGELGRAIAQFRRSRSLQPRDEDTRANLAFARESIKDAIGPPEPSPVLSTVLFWHYRLSRGELAALAVILSILFWSVATLRLYRRDSEIAGWILMGLLVVLVGTLGSLAGHRFLMPTIAVIVPQEIDAFTAPNTDSVVRFKLHAGTELRVRDEREGWLRIILPDDQQGWIEAVWAEVIEG